MAALGFDNWRLLPGMRGDVFELSTAAGPKSGTETHERDRDPREDAGDEHSENYGTDADDRLRGRCTMSAAVVILPRVWATAARQGALVGRKFGPGSMGSVGLALVRPLTPVKTQAQPVRLEVVQAKAEPATRVVTAELAFYRKYTEGMLRRYMRLSMQGGRTPSLLGRELFRGKVTSYKMRSFDDVVIFVHDVNNCLERLGMGKQHLIRRIALQEYTQGETAAMLGLSLRTVVRQYSEAIDELTAMFLEKKMLEPHK